MKAEIIAIGSELLTPFRQDTNSLYLTEKLNQLGVEVAFKTVVGDTGTEANSGDFYLEDSYVYHHFPFDTDPATGLAWTRAGFNAKRFGVKVTV